MLVSRIAPAALAAGLLAAPAAATTYDVTDWNDGPEAYGFWAYQLVQPEGGGVLPIEYRRWTLSDSKLVEDATSARMTGTATNKADANLAFTFDITFLPIPNPPGSFAGYCQGQSSGYDCTAGSPGFPTLPQAQVDTWSLYEFGSATLVGLGEMAGLTYTLDDVSNGVHPPQKGVGGNGRDTDEMGLSTWVSWRAIGTESSTIYDFAMSSEDDVVGHADFIVDLAVIPLPPAMALMLLGVGALGVAGRRRRG